MQIGDLRDIAALHGWRVQRFPEQMDDRTIDVYSRGHLLVHVHYDAHGNATRGYRSRLGQLIDSASMAGDQAIRRAVATWLENF